MWGEGIEIVWLYAQLKRMESLPVWGEWIEILPSRQTPWNLPRLSPCGESGLKYFYNLDEAEKYWSLPVWGEWIEIGGENCH